MKEILRDIASLVDFTLLKPESTWEDIKKLCDDAVKYGCASVCIPPCFVKDAKKYVENRIPICTVIGFPNGYSAQYVKASEAREAIFDGADEVDMVINIGKVKEKDWKYVEDEIRAVCNICRASAKEVYEKHVVVKVIIETCLLTEEEKVKMCEIVAASDADYIKTSTGFSTGGATVEDVELFKKYLNGNAKIKAAGKIRTPDVARAMIEAGADRLGISSVDAFSVEVSD